MKVSLQLRLPLQREDGQQGPPLKPHWVQVPSQ
jgi:hypothetical protein